MDEYSSRRTAGGLVISTRSSSLVLRNSSESSRDRNVQVCSRVGCSSKLKPVKPSQVGSPSKARTSKAPFRPPGLAKEVIGSSSKAAAAASTTRKPMLDVKRKSRSHIENDSESSSVQEESEGISESSGKTQMRVHPDPEENESAEHSSASAGAGSSSGPSNRLVKRTTRRFGSGGLDSPAAASSASFAVKRTTQGTRNDGASTSKCNLKNLRCNSISDVVASGCSSSTEPTMGRRRDIGRKRVGEPESSLSARGRKISGPMMDDKRNESTNRGISIDSRRTRNLSPAGDSETTPVRTRRSIARTRLVNQENRSRLPLVESPLMTPSSSRPGISLDSTAFSSVNQFSAQNPSSHASSFSRPGSGGDHRHSNRSSGPYEVGISRSFMNRDSLRQYNLDGIAEILLALERIEQEEEPAYEQLLVLETNLFLGGLAFHDQHRDMRLDIDDMSYEELLALEERIGTVSTGVPEEDLRKCLKRTTYHGITDCRENEDDVKCSICQEEYADGEDVGRLSCDHRFHVECIQQWLRLKNWCPICKASALPSPSSPSLS